MSKGRRDDPTLSFPASPSRLELMSIVVAPGTPGERRIPVAQVLCEDAVVIGSAPDADIVVDDPHVSARHCELRLTAAGLQLLDLGSRNGTKVHGVAVSGAVLVPGIEVTIGSTEIRVLEGDDGDEEGEPPTGDDLGFDGPSSFGGAIGTTPAMRRVFGVLTRLAPTDLTVTILGETGTGKDVLARAIHEASPRRDGPFVVFDCGAAAPTLIESQLFGHERGAFTGAHEERRGAFERASGGTLFLDEIGELALELQPKLLRAIEQRRVARLGSTTERPVDVRIVCATNRELETEVSGGRFRHDLFFRVNVAVVRLPPLRERPDDLLALIDHFIGQHGGLTVSPDALSILTSHDWPGNVRELRNVIAGAAAVSDGRTLKPRDFILFSTGKREPTLDGLPLAGRSLESIESAAIRQTLQQFGGNKLQAARALGIAPSTLYAKLKKYELG